MMLLKVYINHLPNMHSYIKHIFNKSPLISDKVKKKKEERAYLAL